MFPQFKCHTVLFDPLIGPYQSWSGPRSNGNERVFHIPQISKAGVSPSDCLISYPGHLLGRSYPSAEIQSVYSTASPTQLTGLNLSLMSVRFCVCTNLFTPFNVHFIEQKQLFVCTCNEKNSNKSYLKLKNEEK